MRCAARLSTGAVVLVDLVAQHHEGEVVGVRGTRLREEGQRASGGSSACMRPSGLT